MQHYSLETILAFEIDPAFRRRARLLCEWVGQLETKKKQVVILDLGCGRGFYSELLARLHPTWKIIGLDASTTYLKQARGRTRYKNVEYVLGDANSLQFKNNSFDAVVCSELLEHVDDDVKVMKEIYRVLQPKGVLAASVPHSHYPFLWDPINWTLNKLFHTHINKNIWWLAGIWADHERLYDEKAWIQRLERVGFTTEKLVRSTKYCLPFAHFLLYGIGKNIVERGFAPGFNRFTDPDKKSGFVRMVSKIFNVTDGLNDTTQIQEHDAYMNLVGLFRK